MRSAIAWLKAACGLDDLDHIVFYDKPLLKFERLLETYLACAPRGFQSFRMAMPVWLKEKLLQKTWHGEVADAAIGKRERNRGQAAVCRASSKSRGVGLLSFSVRRGRGSDHGRRRRMGHDVGRDRPRHIARAHSGNPFSAFSLGLLYSAFTYYTGFKVNSGEYKVMGLAPTASRNIVDLILDNIIDLKADGIPARSELFQLLHRPDHDQRRFHDLFGAPPREPEDLAHARDMDLAASIQRSPRRSCCA